MNAEDYREEARRILTTIKEESDMPVMLAAARLSQALTLMPLVHNACVEPEARVDDVYVPTIGQEQVVLLRQAFEGDAWPLIRWLSPYVPYDPSWICGILP